MEADTKLLFFFVAAAAVIVVVVVVAAVLPARLPWSALPTSDARLKLAEGDGKAGTAEAKPISIETKRITSEKILAI
jgi:hypothetical protein